MTWVGGNTTEVTTTSTTVVDLIAVSSLSIGASIPFLVILVFRTTAGAIADAFLGFKINTTVVMSAAVGGISNTGANQAESGQVIFNGRGTADPYLRVGGAIYGMGGGTTQIGLQIGPDNANFPTAPLTDIVSLGVVSNAAISLGSDEMHVYTQATS